MVQSTLVDRELGFGLRLDSLNEIFRESKVHRDSHNSGCDTCPENGCPFHAILGPDEDPIAFLKAIFPEIFHHRCDPAVKVLIARNRSSEAVRPANGFTSTQPLYFRKQILKCLHGLGTIDQPRITRISNPRNPWLIVLSKVCIIINTESPPRCGFLRKSTEGDFNK